MFAILRIQKLKHGISVQRSMKHALRTQDTPNADTSRLADNTASVGSVEEALDKFSTRLATQKKLRSNAVLAIEYLMTASPDAMNGKTREQQDAYFADCLQWLEKKHGAENVVGWGIHRDETTPHMYAIVVPIDDKGKLNCRNFIGGAGSLRAMQTDFANVVGNKNGLVRGIEGSKARHTSIQKYYSQLNSTPDLHPLQVPKPEMLERIKVEDYGSRVADSILEQLRPTWDSIQSKANEFDHQKHKLADAWSVVTREKQNIVRLEKENEAMLISNHVMGEVLGLLTQSEIEILRIRNKEMEDRKVKELAEMERQAGLAQQIEIKAVQDAATALEWQRRVDLFTKPSKGLYGAENVYQSEVKKALLDAGGDLSKVNWAKVDGQAAAKAIRDHGQKPDEVAKMLFIRSPLHADPANHHKLESWIERNAATLEKEYKIGRAARDSGHTLD